MLEYSQIIQSIGIRVSEIWSCILNFRYLRPDNFHDILHHSDSTSDVEDLEKPVTSIFFFMFAWITPEQMIAPESLIQIYYLINAHP